MASSACGDEQLWLGRKPPELPATILKVTQRKLEQLNSSETLLDLKVPPGNRLEALKGDRKGQHGIRVNEQYRLCFNWKDDGAHKVEISDYH